MGDKSGSLASAAALVAALGGGAWTALNRVSDAVSQVADTCASVRRVLPEGSGYLPCPAQANCSADAVLAVASAPSAALWGVLGLLFGAVAGVVGVLWIHSHFRRTLAAPKLAVRQTSSPRGLAAPREYGVVVPERDLRRPRKAGGGGGALSSLSIVAGDL